MRFVCRRFTWRERADSGDARDMNNSGVPIHHLEQALHREPVHSAQLRQISTLMGDDSGEVEDQAASGRGRAKDIDVLDAPRNNFHRTGAKPVDPGPRTCDSTDRVAPFLKQIDEMAAEEAGRAGHESGHA